ncbi:unnamed protein product, partial [Sphagnum troendelagicum]
MNIMYLVYYYTIGKPMEQDLRKAFGGANVNASLAIITKLGGVQVLVMSRSYNFGALQISVSVVDSFILFHFVDFLGIFFASGISVQGENWPHKCVKSYTNAVFIYFIWNTF